MNIDLQLPIVHRPSEDPFEQHEGIKIYALIADRPSAADFGAGTCQVGGVLYASDGSAWSPNLAVKNEKTGIVRVGNISRVRSALSAATAAAPIRILRIGDSTTVGLGSGAGNWAGAAQRNCSYQFAALTDGIVTNDSFIGDAGGNPSPGYNVYNPNVTLGNGWGTNTATLGGLLFKYTVGGTGTLKMTLPDNTISVDVYALDGPTATVRTDIGDIGSITPTGSNVITKYNFAVQAGAAYVEIASPSTTFYVLGIVAINATQKVLLLNAGYNGGLAATFTPNTNAWDAIPVLKKIAPKLTVVALTINDANAPTVKATYQASLVTIVEAALVSGDVALEFGAISNTANSTNGDLYNIRAAMMEVAEAYNLSVLSTPAVIDGGFAGANAAGYMADSWHLTYAGYTQEAMYAWKHFFDLIQG